MSTPEAVWVEPTGIDPMATFTDEHQVPTVTFLFREDTMLAEALRLGVEAYQIEPSEKPFHVLSVGCSYGAEIDTAIAYLTREVPELGRLSLTGIDINPVVLEAATEAKYVISAAAVASSELDLVEHGFTVESSNGRIHHVNSEQLRAGHDVNFIQADMRRPVGLADQDADLVLCNNVLYHLTPQDATDVVWNAVDNMAVGGIMSWEYMGLDSTMKDNKTTYTDWRIEMGKVLADDGITPIKFNEYGAPYMFFAEE